MRWSGETLAGQERRYRAQQIAGIGDDIQNHSVKKKGKVVLKAVVVLGMSYLPTPQNSSGRSHGTKKNLFCSLQKVKQEVWFLWMNAWRPEAGIQNMLHQKNSEKWECCRISFHEHICGVL